MRPSVRCLANDFTGRDYSLPVRLDVRPVLVAGQHSFPGSTVIEHLDPIERMLGGFL